MNIENHNNSGFSSQLAVELATAMMRNMAVLTCRGERSISDSDLEEIRMAEQRQPPFSRPPVRPNGCFRGLPQKANS